MMLEVAWELFEDIMFLIFIIASSQFKILDFGVRIIR